MVNFEKLSDSFLGMFTVDFEHAKIDIALVTSVLTLNKCFLL